MTEQPENPWHDASSTLEERVDALLDAMSLSEMIGQLGSFWMRPEERSDEGGDVAPMESVMSSGSFAEVSRDGLGHLTRVFGSAPVTVAEGRANLARLQAAVRERSRFGIPAMAHEECLTGLTAWGATVYPAAIAWGATFDPDLVREMSTAIGEDMAALGVQQGLSPLLDVVRDYRWGRVEETIAEDPLLVGMLGTAYVRGLQSAGISATLKHFVGYSASRAGRNHAPVSIGRRELEDVLLPPFEMAVREGGVDSVMNSYSDLDGVPAAASRELLTGILRDRWGFRGTVVSDYWAVNFLQAMHHVAADLTEAGALSLHAGMDVELPETGSFAHLEEAVERGLLDRAELRTAARRILLQKAAHGLLDANWEPGGSADVDLDSPRNRDVARRLAEESIVLLSNDEGVLPLRARRIALVGPIANDAQTFLGCYSFPNHVMQRHPDLPVGLPMTSLADAMREEFASVTVSVTDGVPVLDPDTSGIEEAVTLARAADVVVAAVGDRAGMFGHGTSGEGCDVETLDLPGVQNELLEALIATGTPVVLLVVSGRPYALGRFTGRVAAMVQAFMPGCEGGSAIAGVLSGRVNPSGKLPVGIPAHRGGQPGTYLAPPLGWFSDGVSNLDPRPLFPFGHGRSYTEFEVSDLRLSGETVPTDGSLALDVTVRNSGARAGAEVVQCYLSDKVAQVVRPIKQLVAFRKVHLEPGEARRLHIELHTDLMSFSGKDLARVVEPGDMGIAVGTSSEDLPLSAGFQLVGPLRVVGEGRVLSPTIIVH
ncbi:beta-glucosidase [uncultured Tessaracoccus sp.]|uniref:beta-glucosidase family protein n=1 Tax=uncultured Tessaracoccus sp. TaxID=905023 RepID=UPI0025E9572D|nr:glycoside hydrolase family 3 N-terminal domain-containing protein [uncultured Tessaracoccus sp.]